MSQRGVWAIISFVYVLEPNTASTWRVGVMRLVSAPFAFLIYLNEPD